MAVEPGKVSWTAQSVCLFRAIAAMHPDLKLRNPDYLAEKFVFIPYALRKDYEAARMTMNSYGAGTYYYINARTHYIDTLLKHMADTGATQVIILGAGFDSRGYRFAKDYPQLRFFEVDLPATIEWKKEKVIRIFGRLPETVVYAPIDFNTQKLGDVLGQLGYNPKEKSFFIWEGVTMYITEEANRGTLTFVKNHAAAGSTVVFDYILRPVIEGQYEGFYGAAESAATVAAHGEPYVCGWTAREAEEMIGQIGLRVVSHVGTDFLTRRYLLGTDGRLDGKMGNFCRIMYAGVP
jgi:methyltransferase (TIGR00027 family)